MLFWQELISGLGLGATYAPLALALVLIYRTAGIGNFAQGGLAVLSTYIAWEFFSRGLPIGVAFALTVVVSFLIGGITEFVLVRRVTRAGHLGQVVFTFGLYVAVTGAIGLIWGYDPKKVPSLFPETPLGPKGFGLTWGTPGTIALTAFVGFLLYLIMAHTKPGLIMRAVVSNRQSSRLAGINIKWSLTLAWALSCAVGGVAGVLAAPVLYLSPNMMDNPLIIGFAGAVLGGMTSYIGAVAGSLILGVALALISTYVSFISSSLEVVVAIVIITVVVSFRPQGLFGSHLETQPW
jgi:branched-chain amino acid transport system permease protein